MKGGLLEYSLDRSQDQIEEVEVEGDLPKDKNKYKKSKSQPSLCCIARDVFEISGSFEKGMVSRGINILYTSDWHSFARSLSSHADET